MRFVLWNAVLTLLATALSGALIPEPEVKIEVLQKPFICHRKTKGGDLMLLHYEGYLEKDGSLFHSTHKHNNGQPIWFTLGILEALKGWDLGLKGMCVGEKRKLIIPPALGYGKEGKGRNTSAFLTVALEKLQYLLCIWIYFQNKVKVYLKKEFEKHGAVVNESHHDVLVEDIFDKEDEDRDGFISAREFTYEHDEL
ncbi:peptidyl-prolyl cis-trans isomerase FKBP14 [Oryctolagus cuniculus]|uniref:peptidyl-prolyl cis-trans isomerase FKBP14 n=1 Tax=Oryctolagus cuniculus TaxID=9986 RepID=UPI003879A2D6